MRVLLTGASGFLGQHVLPFLLEEHEVVVFGRKPTSFFSDYSVHVIQVDLCDQKKVERAVYSQQCDALLHLAWSVPPGGFWTAPSNLDSVQAGLTLIRAFGDSGGKRMVFAGSCAEYDWQSPMPLCEATSPCDPDTLYSTCKDSLRRIAESYAALHEISCLWCRIFWPYGRGEPAEKFLSNIITRLLRGERARCHSANLKRDYIHAKDVGYIMAKTMNSSLTGVLNIGSGDAVSLKKLATTAAQMIDKVDLLEVGTIQLSKYTPECVVASVERLRREFTWIPKIGLQEGIQNLIEDIQKNIYNKIS